jgi:hypothetical protein
MTVSFVDRRKTKHEGLTTFLPSRRLEKLAAYRFEQRGKPPFVAQADRTRRREQRLERVRRSYLFELELEPIPPVVLP